MAIKSDETIKQDWNTLDNADIKDICERLKIHEQRIQDYLVDCVAALCDVDKFDMMTNVSTLNVLHSRWLFWYAYRYMTNEPFVRIREITQRYGKTFTEQSISNSVNKMGAMICNKTIWTKRWAIIKHIIKLRDNASKNNDLSETIEVVVRHPKNVEIKLKTE